MDAMNVLMGLMLVAAAWHVAATVRIYDSLRARGMQPKFLLLRLYGPLYAHQYRKLTRAETGRTGRLFYHWIVSINASLVGGIFMLLVASA